MAQSLLDFGTVILLAVASVPEAATTALFGFG
jgi:hypothetical protein